MNINKIMFSKNPPVGRRDRLNSASKTENEIQSSEGVSEHNVQK